MDSGIESFTNETVSVRFPKRDPLYIVIPITILYSTIFVTGIVGNVSTCVVIARNRHMHTATNYYLFSLAVSDLLLLITGLPQEMYYIWSRYPYVFGEAFCLLRGLAAETSANATVLTITAFTIERYVAICHPFLAHTMSKLSRAVKFILAIWVVALAFAIPQALQFGLIYVNEPLQIQCNLKKILIVHSFEVSTLLFFIAPMTLITILYALIGLRLRRSALLTRNSGSFGHGDSGRKGTNSCRHHSSQRVLKMLVAVVVAFFICWAPFHTQRLVAIYITNMDGLGQHVYSVVTYISGILYYVSTTINPILYHIMSLKFREAFKDTYSKCCWPKRKSRPYLILSRGRAEPESGRSLTDSSAQHSLTNQQTNRPNDSFSQPETQPIMVMECKSTQLPPLCTRCQQHPQKPLIGMNE
uniref:Pyrokinin-1 receptor variant C n=1 Tax=Rhodnius prolixus TaxID=13249 RepID=I7DBT2_RHOPR|nr:pyrokinin-1 receptor variant C [Rhodnius prolixus]